MPPTPGNPKEEEKEEDPLYFWVLAESANPDFGSTSGSGKYAENSTVTIEANPAPGCKFIQWSGDFSGTYSGYSFLITRDIHTSASFILKAPCNDNNLFKSNPLGHMELQPANGWNILGATYGYTRKKGTKFHNGIDLWGEVGTPVFAMYSGVIGRCITTQPNRIEDKYPLNYNGNRDDAGNRTEIKSTVKGANVIIKYWHLQEETPLAINPRTGAVFKENDLIYQGEVLGYIGVTGNADKAYPHLHLTIFENGKIVNPTNYLNATISTSKIEINTPCK